MVTVYIAVTYCYTLELILCNKHVYCYMCMRCQDMGACWLPCRGPIHYVSMLNSGFGSCWKRLVGMNLISSEPQVLRLSKALWG